MTSIPSAVPQPIASKLLPDERVIWWGVFRSIVSGLAQTASGRTRVPGR